MFFTVEKLEARTRQLEAFRYRDMVSLDTMSAMEGHLDKDDVYKTPPEEIRGFELHIGDDFIGRDRYLWMQKVVRLPRAKADCQVAGVFDFGITGEGHNSGFESLLYVNGERYQGVDSNHKDVIFDSLAGQEAKLTFLLWTGLEGGGPKKEQFHKVRRAEIGYLHLPTDEFYYYSKAIYKTLKLLPDTDTEKHQLMAALDHAYRFINWDDDKFYDTIGTALSQLMESLEKMEKHSDVTVNAVGHTHIDVAWLWRLKHTREKAQRSFATVLRLMEEFDDFLFLQTQAQLYQYIKNDAPELYESIKERVKEKKWEVDGAMWVEADCNISSGEALVRQLTEGILFFKEEFGVSCRHLWLPDVFGYSSALPQILKQCNIKTFMTTKISWNQYNAIPHDLFKWRGLDGSEILTYFITTPNEGHSFDRLYSTYNGLLSPRTVIGSWYKFKDKALSNETLISYGYGDGGGGVNRNMLKMRRVMDKLPGLPNVKNSTAGAFFDRLHEKVDTADQYVHTWDGELYFEYHRGTYTSQAANKKFNRKLEFGLFNSEWLSALAFLKGGEYPQRELKQIWRCVLLHQFHDIIPGSSIREVYEDSIAAYEKAAASLREINAPALDMLVNGEDGAFTCLNPCSFWRRDLTPLPVSEEGSFYDSDGQKLPAQRTEGGWLIETKLAPLSARTITFCPDGEADLEPETFAVDLKQGRVETPFYQVAWNEEGYLSYVYDKENEREVLAGTGNVLELYEDKPMNHDNWDIDIYYMQKRETAVLAEEPKLVECGALRCVIRFVHTYNKSVFVREMIVYRDSRRIDFWTKADWHEKDRLLKVSFPLNVRSQKASYDIQFGHVERPTHFNTSWDWARFEVVGHKWGDISEANYGVSILNDCKYGYSAKDSTLKLTMLKSTKFPDTECDMGSHEFTYALLPHSGTVSEGDTIEESVRLNQPVEVAVGRKAEGLGNILNFDSDSICIDAVKKAEQENCIVVRMHECRGGSTRLSLTSDYGIRKYALCNLLEENLAEPVADDTVPVSLKPFELCTVKLWF
ncbi:alpha-mannosidase [Ruminococcus gauvreauii]|uniref:Alpha-mannosidase n=1 Tax=Ruminococcus gauvreauii TaxID=438033 RepID=A0ABY5VLB8_9FIRM|nr:alpha-mannosidase [Ruminococcus gauvreauii]UWP60801.1 alpha-mannosidase [Ruminococcus gauvreauii]